MKNLPQFRVLCAALICTSSYLYAQVELQHRVTGSGYVLGPGDQLTIHVADLDDLPDRPLTIDPSGLIDLPLAGRIKASGQTIPELKAELAQKYLKYLSKPAIDINLVASGSQPVSVVGEVSNPGVHQLDGTKRLLDLLSMCGGLKADAGPIVLVTRKEKWGPINAGKVRLDPATGDSTANFQIDALMTSQASENNIVMRPDDVVSVPRADLVYVVGDVKKAGGFQLSVHETLLLTQALTLAEGLGPDNAAKKARILRQVPGGDGTPRQIPVDVDKIFSGKSPDVQLFANDVLFIPRSGTKAATRRAVDAAIGITTGLVIYR